ncbi:MAG: right-handed parallel beta-helix repeat-containing protein [Candidatus Thorarchaeota archaeon]
MKRVLLLVLLCSSLLVVSSSTTGFPEVQYLAHISVSHDSINITCNADFISQGWSGNGTTDDPFSIQNLDITSNVTCIRMANTTAYFIIRDCQLESFWDEDYAIGYNAVELCNVSNGVLENCDIYGSASCILLIDCSNTEVRDCRLRSISAHGLYGIRLQECRILENNIPQSGMHGVELMDGNDIDFADNQISDSHGSGVSIYNLSRCMVIDNAVSSCNGHGMRFDELLDSSVFGNSITLNGAYGLCAYAINSSFVNNTVTENQGYGIDLEGSGNTLYGNIIGGNGVFNARDRGSNNTWDDSVSLGNAWDDYVGFGSYAIEGEAGSVDRYPLTVPGVIGPALILLVLAAGILAIPLLYFLRKRVRLGPPTPQ